jgi:hypothetical protein
MKAHVRRILAMAVRARSFDRANPSTDASYIGVAARLEELITRADALVVQEREGKLGERGASARRRQLRRRITELLRHLVRVAEVAAKERPELADQFKLSRESPYKDFITGAKAMLAKATEERELFVKKGLGETLLEELGQLVTQFDAETDSVHSSRRAHVGARADLGTVSDEIVEQVNLLDGLNRQRFRDDAERLAAWESARNIVGPFEAKPPTPPEGGDPPPSTGVAPAA